MKRLTFEKHALISHTMWLTLHCKCCHIRHIMETDEFSLWYQGEGRVRELTPAFIYFCKQQQLWHVKPFRLLPPKKKKKHASSKTHSWKWQLIQFISQVTSVMDNNMISYFPIRKGSNSRFFWPVNSWHSKE